MLVNHQGVGLPGGIKWRPDHTHFYTQDGAEAGLGRRFFSFFLSFVVTRARA